MDKRINEVGVTRFAGEAAPLLARCGECSFDLASCLCDAPVDFGGRTYTRRELKAAFDMVCDPDDWKGPVRGTLPSVSKIGVTSAAVLFFTATAAEFIEMPDGTVLVEADGYRAGPAGDH